MLYELYEKVMALEASGRKIARLNVGDPDIPTSPVIVDAAVSSLKNGRTRYASASGEKKLREKIAEMHDVSFENVIITPGSKLALFASMHEILKKGDEVIIPSPNWTAFDLIVKSMQAKTKLIRSSLENNWELDISALESAITSKTKLIILNSPCNPTSRKIPEKTFRVILEICEKKGIFVISDDAYRDLSFQKDKNDLDFSNPKHILTKSFSKTFAMAGWRMGYAIASKELVSKITKLNQITITNVPPFIQDAALVALENKEKIVSKMVSEYKKRAKLASSILSKKFEFAEPQAAFYVFPRSKGLDSEKLAFSLLEKGIAITPGSAFGNYKEFFRVSLTQPVDELEKSLKTISEAVD